MLELSAITIASTEAHTDVAPLMPQSHGVRPGVRPDARRIPSGKAIPMRSPSGDSIAVTSRTRTGVVDPS